MRYLENTLPGFFQNGVFLEVSWLQSCVVIKVELAAYVDDALLPNLALKEVVLYNLKYIQFEIITLSIENSTGKLV